MWFKTPFLFFVIGFTSAFTIIWIFTGESENVYHKRIVITRKDEIPLYLGGTERQRASPSFLLSSERARHIFLKKVEDEVLQGKDPSSILSSFRMDSKRFFALWYVFTPIYSCPHIIDRIGTLMDCGKWMCGINVFEETKEDPCIIYSMGVGEDSTFEIDIVNRTNCVLYAFDHTVKEMRLPSNLDPKLAERIKFFKTGIGSKAQSKDNSNLTTLKEIMNLNGHKWIDFLKMDIERNEFEVFKDIAEDFPTFPFGHLNLEVHLEKRTAFGEMYDLWTLLERRGLRAIFREPNLGAVFLDRSPFFMEFSFINVVDSNNRLLRF